MNNIKYLYVLLMFMLFTPRVYALSYDLNMNASKTSVTKGELIEIEVSLDNIVIDSKGIKACTMNIIFDNDILLESKIRTLNNWSLTSGSIYLFDTGEAITEKSSMFIIPLKINGNGKLKLSNINCSDTTTNKKIADKEISFTVTNETDVNTSLDNNNFDTNADLSNIELNQGEIEFDSSVTDYSVKVEDFDKLEVKPVLDSNLASYEVVKDEEAKKIEIIVNANNGNIKKYNIYAVDSDSVTVDKDNKNSVYIPIFIGIICVLVIINIVRIVKNTKRK